LANEGLDNVNSPPMTDDGAILPNELVQLAGGTVKVQSRVSWPGGHDTESLGFPIADAVSMGGGGAGSTDAGFEVGVKGFFSLVFTQGETPTLTLSAFGSLMNNCGSAGCWGSTRISAMNSDAIEFSIADERVLEITSEAFGQTAWSLDSADGKIATTPGFATHLMPGTYRFAFEVNAMRDDASLDLTMTLRIPMAGDFDGDGVVGSRDLAALLAEWGPHACGVSSDLTHDCQVDESDIFELFHIWTSADDQ
ncbi:MAG: hypothetical protein SGJ09_18290, partial [Phycisphaerae bacterium]|nr:hypothetical protein [Phycisphaerae bacterium]